MIPAFPLCTGLLAAILGGWLFGPLAVYVAFPVGIAAGWWWDRRTRPMATAVEQRAANADPVRRIDRALNWYRAGKADGRAEMLAEACGYLRAAGQADLAAGMAAALGKEGDGCAR